VKELKGAATYEDDDDFPPEDHGLDVDDDDDDMKDDDDGLMLDDEFPPEAFQSDHQMDEDSDNAELQPPSSVSKSNRSSLLSQVNKRPLLPRLTPDSNHSMANSNDSLDLKGMATALNPRSESFMDELIKLHRSHIRDSTESGKQESKLLVNLTMKLGKTSSDRSAMQLTFDNYVRELDEIVRNKMQNLAELQAKIQEHLSQ
jgi:hypothetical protein